MHTWGRPCLPRIFLRLGHALQEQDSGLHALEKKQCSSHSSNLTNNFGKQTPYDLILGVVPSCGRWAYHRCCLGSHHPPAALGPLQTLTVYNRIQPRSITEPQSFWFVHSQLERLEVLCEEHKVLQCFCCTEAFGVQKRKQYVCKDGTIRLARQTRSTQIHYSNAFYKALFLLETNQHWGTIYISSGLAISTTEDGKGSLGLRSPFSSNSLLLAALFNCGCLSLSTTTANCHLTHIVIDVMTVIVHLGFLQVRPGIEGGVQLWLHITPAGLSVPPDSCLIWASRQASVNICKHTYGMSWDKKALYCPFVQVELPSRHRNYSSKRWGIRKVIHASHCQPENFPRTSVNLSIIPWYDSYTLALGAQWFFEGTLDDCQHLHEKK